MRYLKQEEKETSRALWEAAFPEDSRSFDDYYFNEKLKDNRILVKEENGEVISMAHLNPYRVQVRGREYGLFYIVGVATKEECRHRGHMRDILTALLQDMRRERLPFTFLMPAAEAIYLPFGFRFIYDQAHWGWNMETAGEDSRLRRETYSAAQILADPRLIREIARWQQRFLEQRFEVLAVRDEAYIRRLMAELASENGFVSLLYRQEEGETAIAAMESAWGLEKTEQRFLYGDETVTEEIKPKTPAIMARITHLEEFAASISLREDAPVEQMQVILTAFDRLIPENDGNFLWTLDKNSSTMEKLPDGWAFQAGEPAYSVYRLALSVEELAQWLFGYRMPAEEMPQWFQWIRPLEGVCLDEVV